MGRFGILAKIGLLSIVLAACTQNTIPPSPDHEGIFSGEPLWKLQVEGTIVSTVVANNEMFFVRTSDGVIAYDLESQNRLWSNETHGDISNTYPPVIVGEILFVPGFDGTVVAFRISDGARLWEACHLCRAFAQVDSLAVLGSTVFVTRQNDLLVANDLSTGKEVWSSSDSSYRASSQLVVTNDRVIRKVSREITIYEVSTGNILAHHEFDKHIGDILIDDTIIYMITSDSDAENISITAYDLEKQNTIWDLPYETNGNLVSNWLSKTDNTLYVTGGTSLLALSPNDGTVKWRQVTLYPLERVTITDNGMLLARDPFDLFAFDQETGNQIGKLELNNRIGLTGSSAEFGPTVVDQTVLVPIGDNWVYAYALPNP